MFDLGWTELLVIGIVALIVVGPKDLPGMFRTVGMFMGKAKRMAREFSQAMNDAADDSGIGDVQKSLRAAANPMKSAMDEVKKSTESFTEKTMNSGKPKLSPERQEDVEKIRQKSIEMALERQAKEKAAESGTAAPAKKPATRKPAAKKAVAKTAAAKPAAVKTAAAKKPAAAKPAAAKKPAAKAAPKTPAKRKPAPKKAAEDKA